jgi:hypothetical protein
MRQRSLCLYPNSTSSVISQHAAFAYLQNSGTSRLPLSLSPSWPSQLVLHHPVFLLRIHAQSFRSGNGSGTHDVTSKPILKKVTENEGSVWMRYWYTWASIIPTPCIPLLSHYSPPLYDTCIHAFHCLSSTCFFFIFPYLKCYKWFSALRALQRAMQPPFFALRCPCSASVRSVNFQRSISWPMNAGSVLTNDV